MSTLTEGLEVSADLLDEIFARLNERRLVVEREVLRYGEAPSGIKEVFELCRGFERAYMTSVNESALAGKVKEAFLGEKGLAGVVRTLPLEKIFELTNVKTVCRYADGYQPHLVSPDKGVHAMSMEALDKVTGPVQNCVQTVHTLLINAAREAAEKAGEHTEAALVGTSLPMYVPEFKTVIMPAITSALDEWRSDAEKMALMLVDMERSYITAGFFRFVMTNRSDKIQMHELGQRGQQAGQGQQGPGQPRHGGGGPEPKADAGNKSYFPAFGSKAPEPAARPPQQQQRVPAVEAPEESQGSKASLGNMSNNPNDFVAAFFEKFGSDSGITQALSALRWQRRFFIFSDVQKTLYYFKSPEDVPKPNGLRGQINVGECFVDDLDDRGQPRHPGSPPVNASDKAHWMLRIRHKDIRQSVVKEHKSVVLKAESYQAKVEWLARLRKATGEVKPRTLDRPSVKPTTGEQPAAGEPGDAASEGSPGGPPGGSVPPPSKGPNDLSWAQDAEPVLDTHLGQGASAFRGDAVRGPDGRLPPAPRVLLNPIRLQDQVAGTVPSFEVQYDALLSQIGGDCNMYIRMVCDTICTTVPKAVVHCLIRKSEKNLLERLFTVIHKLTPEQMEQLLKEEEQVVERRKQARKVFEDVKSAVFQVHQNLERRNMTTQAERPDKVVLQANVFAYAGMPDELSSEQRAYFDKLFSDPQSPESMRFWATLHTARAPPPPPPSAHADAPPSPLQPQQQQQQPAGARPQGPPPPRGPPPGPQQQQQQQQGYTQGPVNYRVGPPPPGQLGAALGPLHSGPRPGAPPPPVPMRPAPGTTPPPGRRPPPPPPGTR